jgi:hypothetical protein
MNYILVATNSRTGNKILKGPITGKEWLVTPQGSWIADEFERDEKQLKLEVTRYCFKARQTVKEKISLISPSYDQMEAMPCD